MKVYAVVGHYCDHNEDYEWDSVIGLYQMESNARTVSDYLESMNSNRSQYYYVQEMEVK